MSAEQLMKSQLSQESIQVVEASVQRVQWHKEQEAGRFNTVMRWLSMLAAAGSLLNVSLEAAEKVQKKYGKGDSNN